MPVLDNKCMAFLPMSVGNSRVHVGQLVHRFIKVLLDNTRGWLWKLLCIKFICRSHPIRMGESMFDLASPFLFGTFLKVDGNMARWKSGSSGLSGTRAIGMIALVVGVLFQRVCRQRL